MNVPAHRDQLGEWLNDNNLLGVGVEVGVLTGAYSRIVLAKWNGKQYHMVDPWCKQDPLDYRESTNDFADWEGAYHECKEMQTTDHRVILHRQTSEQASKHFDDASLDWCFIDGNHALEWVLKDMDLWWPKIKPGGLFGGHDYGDLIGGGWYCEVKSAVDQWSLKNACRVELTPCSSWWIRKNDCGQLTQAS